MGFASAALVAGAILVHGFSISPAGPVTTPVVTAQVEQRIEREVNSRVDAAVRKAVSATQAEQAEHMASMLDAAEKRFETKRQADMAMVQQAAEYYQKQTARLMRAANDEPRGQ
jgi:hypothetical protein